MPLPVHFRPRFKLATEVNIDIPCSSLVSDLRGFLNDQKLSDVTFIVEGKPVPPSSIQRLSRIMQKGGGYAWKPLSSSKCYFRVVQAHISQFELCELTLLLKLGKDFPVEQFKTTVS